MHSANELLRIFVSAGSICFIEVLVEEFPGRGIPSCAARMRNACVFSLIAVSCVTPGQGALSLASGRTRSKAVETRVGSPIGEVIKLLEKMRKACEDEAKADLTEHDKKQCWCETTAAKKNGRIKKEEDTITELGDLMDSSRGRIGVLKTEIEEMEADLQDSRTTLDTLNKNRFAGRKAFNAENEDLMEQVDLLKEAIHILKQVQFAQTGTISVGGKAGGSGTGHKSLRHQSGTNNAVQQIQRLFTRVKSKRFRRWTGVMEKDFFDLLGAVQLDNEQEPDEAASLLQTGTQAHQHQPNNPDAQKEPTSDDLGVTDNIPTTTTTFVLTSTPPGQKPNELKGQAAGVKSYNARSSKIFGMLDAFLDQVNRDLKELREKEKIEEENYEKLKASTQDDITSYLNQLKIKKQELAELNNRVVDAKADKNDENDNRLADLKYVYDMTEACEKAKKEYEMRAQIRTNELATLDDTLKILTADEARTLYEKTGTFFLQLGSRNKASQGANRKQIAEQIIKMADEQHSEQLALIAEQVKLDSFTKVRLQMDKMVKGLKKQMKLEYDKMKACKFDIDATEDKIWNANATAEDLDTAMTKANNQIQTLTAQIKTLQSEVLDLKIELKKTGEQRKTANDLFRDSISDQRATAKILRLALDRLEKFYGESDYTQNAINNMKWDDSYKLIQIKSHSQVKNQGPNQAEKLPFHPDDMEGEVVDVFNKGKAVLVKLAYIIKEAKLEIKELSDSETSEQADYEAYVKDTSASLADKAKLISKYEMQLAEAESKKSETDEAILANDAELDKLNALLRAHHASCDFLLEYFDIRQKARQEEINGILDAKGILAGAKFGAGVNKVGGESLTKLDEGEKCQSSPDCQDHLFCAVECFNGNGCPYQEKGSYCQSCEECHMDSDAVEGYCPNRCKDWGNNNQEKFSTTTPLPYEAPRINFAGS